MAIVTIARGLFVVSLLSFPLAAQDASTAGTGPTFEAASIKVAKWAPRAGATRRDPGRIDYRQVGLKNLIVEAYSAPDYQVIWPRWLNEDTPTVFDLSATMPAGSSEEQLRLMLQALLAERFALKLHRENQELAVYALTVSPKGLRIHPHVGAGDKPAAEGDEPENPYQVYQSNQEFRVTGQVAIAHLINAFKKELDRPMVDLTGLDGVYDVNLVWAREAIPRPGRAGGVDPGRLPQPGMPAGANAPSLFSALEKQLGLKAEPRKMKMEVLVIDHLEKLPTPN